MLKITPSEIRNHIQIYPKSWVNLYTTNCYAYALGLDVRESEICKSAYQPGTMSGVFNLTMSQEYFLYSSLIESLEEDLKFLDISYREIEPDDQISLNEWKIALCAEIYEKDTSDSLISDFHFLRTNSNGIWTHKLDYYNYPSKKDYSNQIITDPKRCDLCLYEYKKCYALRLNER